MKFEVTLRNSENIIAEIIDSDWYRITNGCLIFFDYSNNSMKNKDYVAGFSADSWKKVERKK